MLKELLLPRLTWAFLGALAVWILLPRPDPIRYPEVIVAAARIRELEPDTVVRWRERIVTRVLEPDQVATAPAGAVDDVARFCAPAVEEATRPPDAPAAPPALPIALLRSVSVDPGYFGRPDRVILTGPLSTGDLRAWEYSTRTGWSARASGDSLIFRQPRFQVLKDVGELLVAGAAGWGICQVGLRISWE